LDKIAIISDIHGNVPALEAVLSDIRARGVETIYCLGDLAGKGPNSIEAVDMIRSSCAVVIMGNWDYMIAEGTYGGLPESLQRHMEWHKDALGRERLQYLKALPIYSEFYFSGRLIRLCHASPGDLFFRVFTSTPNDQRLRLFQPTKLSAQYADVVGYGDIHKAYVDSIDDRIVFNVGSVGNPLDITQASYAIMEGDYGSLSLSPFSIALVKTPYDIDRAVRQAKETDSPDLQDYIDELKTAVYRGVKNK
jgi:predicted phosphodiesterase